MNPMETSNGTENEKRSKLHMNPAVVVPRRVFFMSLGATALIVAASFLIGLDPLRLAGGFWLGVIANLINFRLICMATVSMANKAEPVKKSSTIGGYATRQAIAAAALVLSAFLGIPAMMACLIGISMAKFVIQLDSFLSFKM
ncbi:MAG: hypothetical protein FWF59_09905 [Turicibacter sp.]|nr:hypothetical protein [Turicibacter sp.]